MDSKKVYRGWRILPVQSENSDQRSVDLTIIHTIIWAGL